MKLHEKLSTYVTSYTWDEKTSTSFPEHVEVERTIDEIDRLIREGHTVKVVLGDTVLEMTPTLFDSILMPLYPDYIRDEIRFTLDSFTDTNATATAENTPEVFSTSIPESVANNTSEPAEEVTPAPGNENKEEGNKNKDKNKEGNKPSPNNKNK